MFGVVAATAAKSPDAAAPAPFTKGGMAVGVAGFRSILFTHDPVNSGIAGVSAHSGLKRPTELVSVDAEIGK
ncbi:MAG: hypothetical protein NTV22_01370, partial [bacterium]|nr:hypothetical protein [bacterium]